MSVGKLARFGVVGTLVTAFNYFLYVTMISLGFHYLVPTTLGWALGLVAGFIGNKYWTFGNRNPANVAEAARFLLAYLLQLAFGSCTLILTIDGLAINARVAFFVNVALTATFSFLFLDKFVFPGCRAVTRFQDRVESNFG